MKIWKIIQKQYHVYQTHRLNLFLFFHWEKTGNLQGFSLQKEKEFVEEKAAMENYKKQSPESNGSTLGDLLKEAKDK